MRRESFYGWRVVGAAFVAAAFSWGISFYGPPVFLEVLHRTRGWPIAAVSAAITLHFLSGAALVANFATLQRRFGLRATTRAGVVLTGLGLLGWSQAPSLLALFAAAIVSGSGWALTGGAALNAMISPWFVRRRPAALGMAYNGASTGGILFSPLWVALIGAFGFPVAAGSVAACLVVVLWVLAGRYFGRDPAAMGLVPDGDAGTTAPIGARPRSSAAPLAQPWRDGRFVTLALASTFALIAQIGLISHLFSHLAPVMGAGPAGLAMGSVTAFAIGGRVLIGWLMPAGADRRLVSAINISVQVLGSATLLLAGDTIPLLLLGAWLFGAGLGNVTSLPPLIAQSEFRPGDVPRVVALVTATGQAGYALAPAGFGLLLTVTGSGTILFAGAGLIQLAAISALLFGWRQAQPAFV